MNKLFRVRLASGYDNSPIRFQGVFITSSERVLTTNEEGLTPYERVPGELGSIQVAASATEHEAFAGALQLSRGAQQTVSLSLEPSDVALVVNVTSGGQPVDDATVQMLGPSGRLQTQGASGGRATFKLRPGAWTAVVTSPTHSEARQAVAVPLGQPSSATVTLKRTVAATPTTKPTAAPTKGKGGTWVMDGEPETQPAAPYKGVRFTPKTGTTVGIDVYNGDVDEHNWNAPPQTITTAGWTANVTASTQTVPSGREYPIICVDGGGFVEPKSNDSERVANQCATCMGEAGKGCSASKSFHMTPREGATSLEIRIGCTYKVTYIYRYKQAP